MAVRECIIHGVFQEYMHSLQSYR